MVMFDTLEGNSVYLCEDSIDGGYVSYYENTHVWSVNFYIHGQRVSYRVDRVTAESVQNYFYKRKVVRL